MQARNEEESSMRAQHAAVKEERARQAEARLKYLLSQSDIFAHFGAGKSSLKSTAASTLSQEASGRRSHRTAAVSDDLDEDEKALLNEEEGEEEAPSTRNTMLLKQPSIVSGGQMRFDDAS